MDWSYRVKVFKRYQAHMKFELQFIEKGVCRLYIIYSTLSDYSLSQDNDYSLPIINVVLFIPSLKNVKTQPMRTLRCPYEE